MPASTIAHVLLRLFALSWILKGLAGLPQVIYYTSNYGFEATFLISSVGYIVAGFVGWILAPLLGLMIAGKSDDTPTFPNVTSLQLNTTMIVGIGIYFIMSNFANVFGWVHYFVVNRSPEYRFHQNRLNEDLNPSYYELTEPLMTLVAGIALVCAARPLARKMSAKAQEPATD